MNLRCADGYALLAALVVVTVAALLASACVTAVLARQTVTAADAGIAYARGGVWEAFRAAAVGLRWGPAATEGGVSGGDDNVTWEATWRTPTVPGIGGWPVRDLTAVARRGAARDVLVARIELRAEPFAAGVTVAADVDVRSPLTVAGSGLYCGGSLRGREWVGFAPAPGSIGPIGPVADGVQGLTWPVAAVHTLGSIWAGGLEVHDQAGASAFPADTDTHVGNGNVLRLVAGPDPAFIGALRERAADPGVAWTDGVLDVSRLPERAAAGAPGAVDASGYIVVLHAQGGAGVTVVGARSDAACPIVVVIDGDGAIGAPGRETGLAGLVLCTGRLEVSGQLDLSGHLHAQRLIVSAPTTISTPTDWRQRPFAGVTVPVVVALDGP